MKKQLTALLTTVLLGANFMPMGAQALTVMSGEYEGLTWTLADGVLTVGGEGKIINYTTFPDGDGSKYPDWGVYRDEITKIVILEGVTDADAEAFSDYPVLETVVLPQGFDSISARLFQNCPQLREIEGLEHVEYFHRECLNGTAITAESPFVITNGRLQYCDISEAADIVVPEGVTSIGPDAFGNLMEESSESLLLDFFNTRTPEDLYFTITLPDSVEEIDDYAFAGLPMLTKVNIPERVERIGDFAFFNCVRLSELTLGENVQSVGAFAFYNCKEMNSLTILSEQTQCGKYAYGTLFDSAAYWQDRNAQGQHETPEQIAEELAFDPYIYDPVIFYRVDWFNTHNYVYADAQEVEADLSALPWGYAASGASIRSYAGSAGESAAEAAGIGFVALEALGDVNLDNTADATDAAALLQAAAFHGASGVSGLTAVQEQILDVNGDGVMDAVDAAWLLNYAVYTGSGGTDSLSAFLAKQ